MIANIRAAIEELRRDEHSAKCHIAYHEKGDDCFCGYVDHNVKIDAIIAEFTDTIFIRRQLLKDVAFEFGLMYDHIGKPMTPETTSTLLALRACLAAQGNRG